MEQKPQFDFKVVIAGPFAAGKTTMIAASADGPLVATEAPTSGDEAAVKAMTTVGMEYGTLRRESDLFTVELDERFDVVVAGSHFVDDADPVRRAALLASCARHVAADGVVLVERYDPDWTRSPRSYGGPVGPVDVEFEVLAREPDDVVAARLDVLVSEGGRLFRFNPLSEISKSLDLTRVCVLGLLDVHRST